MVLVGLILIAYLVGFVVVRQIPSLFLIGIGVIFCVLAMLKAKAPASYEMSSRATLFYGVLALVIGLLWIGVSV